MLTTITAQQTKDQTVIAELNNRIAKKAVRRITIKKDAYTKVYLMPKEFESLVFESWIYHLSVYSRTPYTHILLFYDEDFTHIEIEVVD